MTKIRPITRRTMPHPPPSSCPFCANPDLKEAPIDQEYMNEISRCPRPGCECTAVELIHRCHNDADSEVYYCRVHGVVIVACGQCGEIHAAFEVAKHWSKSW